MSQHLAIIQQQSQELARIEQLITSPKITEVSPEEVWSIIRYIAKAIGVPNQSLPDEETAFMLVNFIKENFKDLRLAEIKDAADMACAGKLKGIDLNLYGFVFSSSMVGKILGAYRFNESRLKSLQEYRKAQESSTAKSLTDDEKKEIVRNGIVSMYGDFLAGKQVIDYGSVAYSYLVDNGHFKPTADRKWELVNKYLPIIEHDLKMQKAMERDDMKRMDIEKMLTAENLQKEAVRRAKLDLLIDYFQACNELDRDIFEK